MTLEPKPPTAREIAYRVVEHITNSQINYPEVQDDISFVEAALLEYGKRCEPRFVEMKPIKELVRNGIIKLEHCSDDGEFIHFSVIGYGGSIGMWVPRGKQLVVDCETVQANLVKAYPQLFNKLPVDQSAKEKE